GARVRRPARAVPRLRRRTRRLLLAEGRRLLPHPAAGRVSPVEFMSAEHINVMNELLRDAPDVRAACAQLSQPRTMTYRLTDGPGGQVVHWTITFADTVQFSLDEAPAPDVRFVGDWA